MALLTALLITSTLLTCGCAHPRTIRQRGPEPHATVRVKTGTQVASIALEDYVRIVILSEFSPGPGDVVAIEKMLVVQAVVSRTYALFPRHRRAGFDFCSTSHCQLYEPSRVKRARWAKAAAQAVTRTAGVVLWFDGAPARIAFHADCGGRTSAARDVWIGEKPSYLTAVEDGGPAAAAHRDWRFAPARPALLAALNADPRTRVGNRIDRIDVLQRDGGGRVLLVKLDGERQHRVRGEDFRAVLNRAFGARAVRSTRFDIERDADTFTFAGRGFGHGVGLCQVGAFARLSAGASPAEVLARYFPGTSAH